MEIEIPKGKKKWPVFRPHQDPDARKPLNDVGFLSRCPPSGTRYHLPCHFTPLQLCCWVYSPDLGRSQESPQRCASSLLYSTGVACRIKAFHLLGFSSLQSCVLPTDEKASISTIPTSPGAYMKRLGWNSTLFAHRDALPDNRFKEE